MDNHHEPPATSTNTEMFGRTTGERSGDVRDSLTLTHITHLGGDPSPTARAREEPPPPRCPEHLENPTDKPCAACGRARHTRAAWDADADRRAAQQRSAAARSAAAVRAAAIANCDLCDQHGYRGTALCDHDPTADERAARGRAAINAALRKDPA